MPNDIFTGALTSPDWSVTADWSAGQPGTSTVVEQTGDAVINNAAGPAESYVIGGLVLDSGATLLVGLNGELDVSGAGDAAFGSVGAAITTIDVAGDLTLGSDITSAAGTVNVEYSGQFVLDGSGSTQTVTLSSEPSGPGGLFEVDGNDGGANNTGAVNLAGGGAFLDKGEQFGGVISGLGANGQVQIADSSSAAGAPTGHSLNLLNNTMTFSFSSGDSYTLSFNATTNPVSGLIVTTGTSEFTVTVCYVTGTRIKTLRGDVAVEALAVGDLAVTASGEARPIVWIGRKRVDRPAREAWPVRVTAGAFGENQPSRDLFLSPGHAVCIDVIGEVFVPVSELINGVTIAQVEVAEVTYWHVELESHDVLLAEGLPAESYMDAGNRAFFGREFGRLAQVDPERVADSLTRYARPFVDRGPIVEAIRQRLVARAETLGWLAGEVGAAA
jgi:hypothetical protein